MDLFQQFLNRATQGYKQADKALGGWLPGGGTGNPLTTKLQRVLAQPSSQLLPAPRSYARIPGASPASPAINPKGQLTPEARNMLQQLGLSPSVTMDINKTNPIAILGQQFGYLGAAHANPLTNQIYLPGGNSNTLTTLAHEAGHLDENRRQGSRPFYEGILGQIVDTPAAAIKGLTGGEFSPFAQALAPFRLAGGLMTALSDAKEEDYAERFAADATGKMLGERRSSLGGDTQSFLYPSMLYQRGQESFQEGVKDMLLPPAAKLAAGAGQFIQTQIQEALPKPPTAFEDIPNFQLQQFAIESAVDYNQELKNNPNSRLLPRLKKIKDDYWRATKARGLSD